MKMLIICGHGAGDPGAVGNGYHECELTRELGTLLLSESLKRGITAELYPTTKDCYQDLRGGKNIDFTRYGYVFEIHFNADSTGAASGTLLIVNDNEPGITVEQSVLVGLCKLGTKPSWNGIVRSPSEWGSSLLVNSTCVKQGVSHALLETCFITNKNDVEWYKNNKTDIAKMIAYNIAAGFGVGNEVPSPVIKYVVQVGAFSEKENADRLVNDLQDKGYDAFVRVK